MSSSTVVHSPTDSAVIMSAYLARTQFEDLPADVVLVVKRAIADTIACVLAGTPGEEIESMLSLAKDWGGTPSCTVMGAGGFKAPPDNAVMVNAAAVHQYDFDDTHDTAVCHPTSPSLLSALAIAQEKGGVSGKELITAVALGNDVVSRVALAISGRLNAYPWIRATVAGIFGSAAASAKIMGATAEQHRHALGLALPQAGVTLASLHHGGSSVRSIRDGLAYRNGVLAAELAMRGVRGDAQVFDGPYGLYHAYFRGEYDPSQLTGELGTRYETARVSLKPWPSCRHVHATLTVTLRLLEKHAIAFDQIDHILLHVGDINLDRCRPVALGAVPEHRIDLLCNLPFAVGAMLRHRGLPLQLYRDTAMADDVVRHAMPKVKWIHDERQNGKWTIEPGMVDIHTKDGKVYSDHTRWALGHPENPMSLDQIQQKLIDCAAASVRPISAGRAKEIFETVMNLDRANDVEVLARLLA